MMSRCRALGVVLCTLFLATTCPAYVVDPPKIVVATSPDGSAMVRIDPAPRNSADTTLHASASIYDYVPQTKSYRLRTTFDLRNRVAPDVVAISDGGEYLVTCDEWDNIGYSPYALAVYRGTGAFLKAWSLEDIFTAEEISRFGPFPMNAARRRWRGSFLQFLTGKTPEQPKLIIPWRMDAPWHLDLSLDLASLTLQRGVEIWVDPKTGMVVPPPSTSRASGHERK